MSSIVEELRCSKRQLADKFDGSRRLDSTNVVVADNNNNNDDNDDNYNTLSSSQTQTGSLWRPALTPTSTAAARRPGQSRSKRRRAAAELCYDECGALDLTSAKKVVRTSNTAPRRPSGLTTAAVNLVTDDSLPLDLTASSRLPYVYLSTVQ